MKEKVQKIQESKSDGVGEIIHLYFFSLLMILELNLGCPAQVSLNLHDICQAQGEDL